MLEEKPTSTVIRMRRKLWEKEHKKDPYTDEEENEIFLQMFRHTEVRKYCEQSMIYFDTIVPPYKKISATLNSFREVYNGFYRWSDVKLLAKLREKWRIIETIQNKHVEKLFEKNENFKRKLENQSLLDKSKVEIIKKQKPTDKKVQVTQYHQTLKITI